MLANTPPLAERMRPQSLDTYIGQQHLVGSGGVLRKAIELGSIPSLLLWGPPGVGKTTLALIISKQLKRPFFSLSAINAGVKDIRAIIDEAIELKKQNKALPILFIDEIHRFSKSQQDSLLGAVESGIITLIGATTENPSFEVISALLSRCQVYVLQQLSSDEYNNRLSERRAEAVKTFTINQGISASRINTRGKGESEPIADNSNEEGKAKNRRVEIVIVANDKMKADAQKNAG